ASGVAEPGRAAVAFASGASVAAAAGVSSRGGSAVARTGAAPAARLFGPLRHAGGAVALARTGTGSIARLLDHDGRGDEKSFARCTRGRERAAIEDAAASRGSAERGGKVSRISGRGAFFQRGSSER